VTPVRGNPDTRLSLIRAAERLFGERGVDGVSMREVAREAGQRNHSAVLYYFADKAALIDALLARHSDPIQRDWSATLAHIAATRPQGASLAELVSLLVRPLVRKIDDPDGGRDYLFVVADLVTSRSQPLLQFPATMAPGILELQGALLRHMPPLPPALLAARMLRVAATMYCSIADYARMHGDGSDLSRDAFADDLIASLHALFEAPAQLDT